MNGNSFRNLGKLLWRIKMNILHLSDIHFGRNYECYGIQDKFDNKEQILTELIDCVKNLKAFRPDHIVVTGDIAWHGKKNEYEEALIWFEKLLDATGLTGKNITFCVGNHDVNRAYANLYMDYNDDSIQEIDEIYDYDHVHEMEPPIYEYDKFCEKLGVEPFAYPYKGKLEYSYSIGYKDVKFPSQNIIRFVAFNTALLSFMPNISEDKMWIGQKQVKALMHYGIIPNDKIHYTIALFHHAERFLHPNEICEYDGRIATLNLLRKNVDLILCGHTETGGKPIFHQQLGGGKILTAGAAYYSDTHPNAFSILCVPDNEKDVLINPYTYKKGWKQYDIEKEPESDGVLYELPKLGDLQEECRFVLRSDDKSYEIPLKKVSVYSYIKNGIPHVRVDNRKEVLRYLDIGCDGPANGGKVDVPVSLSPKMERNVSAMLKREEYFEFMAKNMNGEHKTEFYIESKSGDKFISGSGLKGTIDIDEKSISMLRKIEKIEKFYDVKFYRPDDLYDRDVEQITLLDELIEEGFSEKLKLGKNISSSFSDLKNLKQFYERALQVNSFCLLYEGKFYCKLFGVKFSLGKALVIAGKYHVDLEDIRYKIDTFMEGDTRQVIFTAEESFKTFFVVDREKAREKVKVSPEYEIFSVEKMGLKWNFIFEE